MTIYITNVTYSYVFLIIDPGFYIFGDTQKSSIITTLSSAG